MNDDEDAHDEEIDVGEEIWWYLAEDKGLGPGLPLDIGLAPRWPVGSKYLKGISTSDDHQLPEFQSRND